MRARAGADKRRNAEGRNPAADRDCARWLRERNPDWSDERIERQILRTYVIDDHYNWTSALVEAEVDRILNGEPPQDGPYL